MLQLENQVKGETFRVPQHLSEINFKYVADKVKDYVTIRKPSKR
nr:MAG TPA: hypothetical protein [Crassvirales sp.]